MIRVLHVIGGMDRGGMETFIMNIYRNIDRKKIQFDFLLHTQKECAYNEEIRSLGGRIFSVPSRKKGILKNRKALDDFFKEHPEYKIVHQHVSSLTYVDPLKIAKKNGIPVRIVHSHNTKQGGSFIHKYIHKYNQLFVESFATHYFACSDLAAKWLYPKKQYKSNNFKIINNAIDTDKFIFNEKSRYAKRKELGIKDEFVIGHIGRFHPQKNHELLIDIFKRIHDKNKNTVLLLVGDGSLRQDIEKKVKALNLKDSVIFTGVSSDIPEILHAMDVFVFPSLYEGLGIVAIEAQASGLHVFASNEVPKEAAVTDLFHSLSLNLSPEEWAEEILKYSKDSIRLNKSPEIVDRGYDINANSEWLMNFYIENAL